MAIGVDARVVVVNRLFFFLLFDLIHPVLLLKVVVVTVLVVRLIAGTSTALLLPLQLLPLLFLALPRGRGLLAFFEVLFSVQLFEKAGGVLGCFGGLSVFGDSDDLHALVAFLQHVLVVAAPRKRLNVPEERQTNLLIICLS